LYLTIEQNCHYKMHMSLKVYESLKRAHVGINRKKRNRKYFTTRVVGKKQEQHTIIERFLHKKNYANLIKILSYTSFCQAFYSTTYIYIYTHTHTHTHTHIYIYIMHPTKHLLIFFCVFYFSFLFPLRNLWKSAFDFSIHSEVNIK